MIVQTCQTPTGILIAVGILAIAMLMVSMVAATEMHAKLENGDNVSAAQIAVTVLSVATWVAIIILTLWLKS